jgi:iron complex outermembrane receptor protein
MLPLIAFGMDLDRKVEFNIPAQDLGAALLQFSQQAHIQVIVSVDIRGQATQGVSGQRAIKQALSQLLDPAGLRYQIASDNSITVAKAGLDQAHDSGDEHVGSGVRLMQSGSVDPQEPGARSQIPSENARNGKNAASAMLGSSEGKANESNLEEVVVTGTHLRGAAPSSPIITLERADIERSGLQSTADVIRSLPQSFGGDYNGSAVNAGGAYNPSGSATANLRGLGSDSTLTLVDGHRLASTDTQGAVDISIIPLVAVDHIDVLTDGASAIYGSDAVGGVVNFALKKHYDGVSVGAAYGDSTDGGGALQRYDILGGKDWGSGGAVLSYEFANQQPLLAANRSIVDPSIVPDMWLLPKEQRNSVFGYVNQSVAPDLSVFAEGLYTSRTHTISTNVYPSFHGLTSTDQEDVRQYGVTTGGSLSVVDDWKLSLTGNFARQSTIGAQRNYLFEVPFAAQPRIDQEFVNNTSQIELSADGPTLQLPSGPIDLAVGAAYRKDTLDGLQKGATAVFYDVSPQRHVTSFYGEANVPLVLPSTTRVGLNSLSVTVAQRGLRARSTAAGARSPGRFGRSVRIINRTPL